MPSTPTGELALAGVDAPIRFGKYTLLTRLATGGMGEVYVAQMGGAAGFEKQVVIKRILPQLANDEQFVRMFLDEARITAQLNHPNICQVFDLGEIEGEYFIAMEYLHGLPLSRVIQKRASGGIDLRVAAGILVQACEGLTYAHDFRDPTRRIDGVVHRDVSPQNLFVTAPGLVKVLDFGVAKLYREGSKTVTVSSKGKHLYMSPEQVNGEPIDQRSDLFALATVMYEALTGQFLFGRATQFLTLQAIVTGDRPRVRELRPDVPEAVDEVLDRALSLKPADRFPSGRALAEALTFAVAPLGGPASIIELAQFVQREHADELAAERARIQRAVARLQATGRQSSSDLSAAAANARARLDSRLGVHDEDYGDDGDGDEYDEVTNEVTGEFDGRDEDEDGEGEDDEDGDARDGRVQPAVDMTSGPMSARASGRSLAFVRLNAQDEVADYFDLRTQRWRRYVRWALVAVITLAAALWFGRDWLGFDVTALFSDDTPAQRAAGDAPPAVASAQGTGPAGPTGAGATQDDRPAPAAADTPARPADTPARPADTLPEQPAGATATPDNPGERAANDAPGADQAAAQPTRDGGDSARPRRGGDDDDRADRRDGDAREVVNGFFTVDAQPYAEIYIDGKKAGLTPLVQYPLAPGRHRVRVVAVETGKTETFRIQISPKKTVTRQVTFSDGD